MTVDKSMIPAEQVFIAKTSNTVGEVLDILHTEDIRWVPILSDDKELLGIFSIGLLIKQLLPKSATVEGGLSDLSFIVGAREGLSEKLAKIKSESIVDHMEKDIKSVHPDTPLTQGILYLSKYGSPIAVTEKETNKLAGIFSHQGAIDFFANGF